jgi:hypothetical protein
MLVNFADKIVVGWPAPRSRTSSCANSSVTDQENFSFSKCVNTLTGRIARIDPRSEGRLSPHFSRVQITPEGERAELEGQVKQHLQQMRPASIC